MRKQNLLILLFGLPLLALGALTACGQDEDATGPQDAQAALTQAGGEKAEQHLARLQEELDLTDTQVAELRTIFEEQREKFAALRDSAPEDREARRDAFHELAAETNERLNGVLTEEQQQRFEELRASRGPHGFGGPHGPWDTDQHLTKLQEELDLTDAQVAQLRTIFEEQREAFQALHESAPEDREARREAFRELRTKTHDRLNEVLTEEQQQRLEELMQSRMEAHGARGAWHQRS